MATLNGFKLRIVEADGNFQIQIESKPSPLKIFGRIICSLDPSWHRISTRGGFYNSAQGAYDQAIDDLPSLEAAIAKIKSLQKGEIVHDLEDME